MDKFNQFFIVYSKPENEENREKLLKEFMLSLNAEELQEFILGNIEILKKDARKGVKAQVQFNQLMSESIAFLEQARKREAA